jgi:hypothetical protein
MKNLVGITFVVVVALASGCAGQNKTAVHPPTPVQTAPPQPIITPDTSLAATVLMYNPVGRFVVLNFPTGNLPRADQVMFIYHAGLKAGEVKITGPVHENNVVADLTSGTAQSGDEVRDQ